MFGYTTAIVLTAAIVAMVWLASRPGEHTNTILIISTFAGLYLKTAYDSDQAKVKLSETNAKIEATHEKVTQTDAKVDTTIQAINGRLTTLIEAEKAKERQLGFEEGRKEGQRETLLLQSGAVAVPMPPVNEAQNTEEVQKA